MDKNKGKTKRRKIKIRLADPNIPDSYICEIIDSSLENEEDSKFKNHLELQETLKSVNNIKPTNYFEVLMSKDNKNINVNSGKESEKIQNTIKVERETEKQSFVTKIQKYRQKNRSTELHLNNEIEKEECKINLSDKSLVQVHTDDVPEENFVAVSGELKFSKDVKSFGLTSSKVLTTCESFSKRKPANILNYFSKIETVTSEKTSRKMKKKRHEEINHIKDSLQVCHTVEKLKIANNKDLEEPDKIGTRETLNGLNKENIKLAPLFTKKEKKVFDIDAQKARTEFLQRGLPSAQKKCKMNCKYIQECETFPIVSHIQQKNDNVYWSNRNISLPFFSVSNNEECIWKNYKKFTCNVNQQPKCFLSSFHNLVKSRIEFSKETLKKVKCEYINLNLDSVIDGFKQKRDKFMKYTKQFDNSKPSNCIQSVLQTDFGLEIYNMLWLEKYKPTSNEILGNMNVVKKLKKWLESWKSFDKELKSLAKSNQEAHSSRRNIKSCGTDDDYDSDIIKSDEESYDLKSPCNVCILSGPSGCGKTTLVYALANELEFNVLEVNASSKRTGKIVLSDLQEATQSHKFHHVSSPAPETNKTKHKNKKTRKQKKNNKIQNKIKIQDHTNDCKISLILIEDADIVFEEHDEGFFSAVASLVQTSKRPLIFLTNDSSCVNLDTFKTEQCLILEMERPSYNISCAILDLVSLLEGINVEKETLKFFVCQNRFDLRKCLLELQFWIQSDEETVNVLQPMDLGHLWWGLSKFLYHQEIMHFERKRVPKRKRFSDLFDSSDDEEIATKKFKLTSSNQKNSFRNVDKPPSKNNSLLYSYFNILDLVSTLDAFRLSNSQEPIPITEYKPKDSLSLEENLEDVSWAQTNLAEKIVGDLITTSAGVFAKKVNVEKKLNFVSPSWEEIRWRKLQEKADEELLGLIPICNKRDKRSIYLDYLPILRNICRHEENRLSVNSKRKNRFYHYLSNLGIEFTEENLSTNCEVFGN